MTHFGHSSQIDSPDLRPYYPPKTGVREVFLLDMADERTQRRLAAILAADVVGYSRLMEADEETTVRTLKAHIEVVDLLISNHNGRVFSTAGDSVMAEFGSAIEAVRAALTIQEELEIRNGKLPVISRMKFRIGVNLGDIIVEGENLFGDGVNVAARIEGLCAPGEVYVSDLVQRQVEGKLELGFEDKGEHAVKNIAKPVRVYRVYGVGTETAQEQDIAAEAPELPDKPSVAVLPFSNMSNDPEQEYFSDGITEDIITELSKISGLFVIARNSSFVYKGSPVSVKQVGRDLGVRYVLEGSVRRAGNRLRITAQLIDSASDHHLWAERYDRELEDVFAVQDEVARQVSKALEVALTPREREYNPRPYTDNQEAYDYFLRGRATAMGFTKEKNAEARKLFERAIELDSSFAAAYALLAQAHWRDYRNQWTDDSQPLELAFETAKKAVALNDSLPLPHIFLAWVLVSRRQYEEAIAEARRAILLDPNFAEGYARLGQILNFVGRPQEGIDLVENAMRLDPHYPSTYLVYLGQAYYEMGKYQEARSFCNRAVSRSPSLSIAQTMLATIYSDLGQMDEARARVAELRKISPRTTIEHMREVLPYKDQALLDRISEALRKAGLPE